MAKVDTLKNESLRAMMGKPDLHAIGEYGDRVCVICGAKMNEAHHIVPRSAGVMYDPHGNEMKKPTIDVCGFGNNLKDADGRYLCHGLFHNGYAHLRYVEKSLGIINKRGSIDTFLHSIDTFLHSTENFEYGYVRGGHWELLLTHEPTKRDKALEMDGWVRAGDRAYYEQWLSDHRRYFKHGDELTA